MSGSRGESRPVVLPNHPPAPAGHNVRKTTRGGRADGRVNILGNNAGSNCPPTPAGSRRPTSASSACSRRATATGAGSACRREAGPKSSEAAALETSETQEEGASTRLTLHPARVLPHVVSRVGLAWG